MESTRIAEVLRAAADGKYASCLQAVTALEAENHPWSAQASVFVLRNATVDQLVPALKLAGFQRGVAVAVDTGDFDTYATDVFDRESRLYQQAYDLIVCALWLDGLTLAFDEAGRFQPEAVFEHLQAVVGPLLAQTTATIAIPTFLPPLHATAAWAGELGLLELNLSLRRWAAQEPRLLLVDLAGMVRDLGRDASLDLRAWFHFRAPFRFALLQRWGYELAQGLAALKGLARKVLVLDCDNTLWGGVVGEEGLQGIALDPYHYPGAAYQTFQRQVLELQRQGVMLALCSKNNEAEVWEVLDSHPACHIHREHLVAWRINWDDKVTNIQALAAELNVGLDSFVFVDDSDVECAHVAQALPMVDVLQVPTARHELPGLLRAYGGFWRLARTAEDEVRTGYYQAERRRQENAAGFADLDGFLRSLALRVTIGPAAAADLPRVAELTQKTNQFNATTRRYSLGEITDMVSSPDCQVLALTVADKFGDYGLTGLAILVRSGQSARLDTFLMSCRILGRKIETVLLAEAITRAQAVWGCESLQAEYLPTAKNGQLAEFFPRFGFTPSDSDEGQRRFQASPTALAIEVPSYITVIRS